MRRALLGLSCAVLISLALPADAAPARRTGRQSLTLLLRQHFRQDWEDMLAHPPPERWLEIRYASAFADLNRDGRNEALVWVSGDPMCGTGGCALLILTHDRGAWHVVGDLVATRPPIRVLGSSHHGWRDIGVWAAGGGLSFGYEARITFEGRTYSEDRSGPPARPRRTEAPGQTLIPLRRGGAYPIGRILYSAPGTRSPTR